MPASFSANITGLEQLQLWCESFARQLAYPAVLGLLGELGSGKTQLTQYLAASLGITQPVVSPSFALHQIYSANDLQIDHLDLYRLSGEAEFGASGFWDLFEPEHSILSARRLIIIEWADRLGLELLPPHWHRYWLTLSIPTAQAECCGLVTPDLSERRIDLTYKAKSEI